MSGVCELPHPREERIAGMRQAVVSNRKSLFGIARLARGFTLVELLVVVAIIGALVAILVPLIAGAIEDAERSGCQGNLKGIGTAYLEYAREKNLAFPRVHDTGDPLAPLGAGTDDLNNVTTNAMDNVWVFVDAGLLTEAAWKCPGDNTYKNRKPPLRYGWTDPAQYSFGIHFPFSEDGATNVNPADPADIDVFKKNYVIHADKAAQRVTAGNGWTNHFGGACYLMLSGNVGFHKSDSSVINGDDMYGDNNAADGDVLPDASNDIVILPGVTD